MAAPPRPDPNAGVFETLLVVDGRAVELDAHLERLAASAAELYGPAAVTDPREAIEEEAAGMVLGRLRANVVPNGFGGLELGLLAADVDPALVFPAEPDAVSVHSFPLGGGLGPHKWVDRTLLEEAEARLAVVGAVPLIVDDGGVVLEASRASVFAVRAGMVRTPPADGRILPGISRSRVLEIARAIGLPAEERELSVGALAASDEVFLAGSVRGVESVDSLDGSPLRHRGDAGSRIATELRRAWLAAPAGAKSIAS